jgi:uncharacterized membrane protein
VHFSRFFAFVRDERGSVAVTSAVAVTALLSFAALALDTGNLFVDKRRQQSANDLIALAAATSLTTGITSATTAANAAALANGYATSAISDVEVGTYVSNAAVAPTQRFTPTTTGTPNAVRITMRQSQPYMFGSLLSVSSTTSTTIQTQSVAAARSVASFGMGSSLANLNNGILNSVLGSLVGGNLSLSLMDYQSLASANISLFSYSNALATRAGVTAGTYSSLIATSVPLSTGLRALVDSVSSSQAAAALTSIIAAAGAQTTSFQLGTLLDLGAYGGNAIGSTAPITANVSALQMLTALLEAANGQQQVATALSVAVTGIASVNLKLAIGEPAAASSLIAVGPTGTTLTTAQTRLRLTLQLVGPSPASLLTVPIVMNIASGTAVLNSVQCTGGDVTTSNLQLGVTPGLVSAWIGVASDTDLTSFSTPLNPPAATLVNILNLVTITGRATASIANTTATTMPFSYTDIVAGTQKTVSTTDYISPLLSSLFGNLSLNTWVLGFSALSTQALNTSIGQTLATDVTPIDTIIASVLIGLGVSVGNATVWVNGVQCGQGALVN